MLSRRTLVAAGSGLVLLAGAAYWAGRPSREPSAPQGFVQEERVIAGGPRDSLEVRHLLLKGGNEEIGRRLGLLARQRYGAQPSPSRDPLRTQAQRLYIERNFPILHERMRGVAASFDRNLDDDAWNHSGLDFTQLRGGCSVIYVPPGSSATGKGVVSRDYDYSTGSIRFGFLEPGMLHSTSRPYLLELHPDRGYPSLAMVAYDLLSGVLDGMNSEGLTVTMLMDDELFSKYPVEATDGPSVGLGELQTQRLLLDTCASAAEAKRALLLTKQYYQAVPVHYLIADRFGNAFVWEYSQAHNREYIVENPAKPLVSTNFSLHKHLDNGRPPPAAQAKRVCPRYCRLAERLATSDKLTEDFIKQTHKKADAELPAAADPSRPPVRTFWHALYHPEERRAQYSFYLRDEPDPERPGKIRVVRSDYLEFRLAPTNNAKEPSGPASPPSPPAADEPAPRAGGTTAGEQRALAATLKSGGAKVELQGDRVVRVLLDRTTKIGPLLPLLKKLPDLEELAIHSRKMDDAGMAALQGLPKLSLLNLTLSSVGDDGLRVVATLPRLRSLYLGATKVTDAGLAHLKDLTQLEVLIFRDTAVTDAGVSHLAGLTNVTGLDLAGTKVTDGCLQYLRGMSRLTKLKVARTAVTDEGLAKARKSLPFWLMVEKGK
jgi:penicillin V acylase-like amidase (Ntn superfamily)